MSKSDDNADAIISAMVGTAIGTGVVPVVTTPIFIGAMSAGVVGIGACYDVTLTKDEAWKLVKQFFSAAGFTFMATAVSGKVLSALLAGTGIGYVGAAAIDASISAAIAYAVGGTAKSYFKGERDKKQLGKTMQGIFKSSKS